MIQYIVILLDDTSVSFCHYKNQKKARRLIPVDSLKSGILFAMKQNLNIQFVYPEYDLPADYKQIINSVDHTDIKPAILKSDADVVVFNDISQINGSTFNRDTSYVLRTSKADFFENVKTISSILPEVERLNIVIKDIEFFFGYRL